MPDACCTRGLVCKIVQRNAHEHTGSAEAIRHSLRNGFTAYAVISSATNSSCHRRLANLQRRLNPVGHPPPSQSLTPATGARTTRFCRTQQPVSALRASPGTGAARQARETIAHSFRRPEILPRARRRRVHRFPHSTYRDDAYAPLHEAGWCEETPISANEKRIIFRGRSGRPKSR
jgi:hypothetical protein